MFKKVALCIGLTMVIASNSMQAVAAQTAASGTTQFTLNITPPPCNVTVPASISLGDIGYNATKEGNPFEISIRCDNSVRTAINATPSNGTSKLTDTTLAFMNNGQNSGATLALLDTSTNKEIKFTGNDTDVFCNNTQDRSCSIKPKVTTGVQGMIHGNATATVKFDLLYL